MIIRHSIHTSLVALAALVTLGCGSAQPLIVTTPAPGPEEFGRALAGPEAAAHIATFDALDFEVFTHQQWGRLHESHAHDVIVSWPDGHDTTGIETHIHDLQQLFIHAPDTAISVHPVRIASGDWTAVTGIMTGTFTQPMPLPDGTHRSELQPAHGDHRPLDQRHDGSRVALLGQSDLHASARPLSTTGDVL